MTVKLVGADDATADGGGVSDKFYIFKYTAVTTGVCSEVKIKSYGASGYAKVAVYADNAGEPGARLAKQDTGAAIVDGWNTIQLEASCSITLGTDYWLAINSGTNGIPGYLIQTCQRREKVVTYSTFTFPDPAGTGFSAFDTVVLLIAGWGTVGWTHISHNKGVAAAAISHKKGIVVASISHVKGVAV